MSEVSSAPAATSAGVLAGQIVLVTGSSSGIGAAVARAARAAGARVVVNSARSVEPGRRLARELAGAGEDALYVQADIAQPADGRRLIAETIERFGRLDHLVNNAGTTQVVPHADLDAVTDEVFRRILDVNLLGTWNLSRLALPHLRETRGSIVNITSIAGIRQTGSSIPYAVSKAALNHLTRLMANVVGPEVRVNAVAPGLIETPWTADWTEAHQRVAAAAPLRRSGTPEDIAQMTLALLSSPYTTGQIIAVDGGLTLRT